MRRVTIRSAPKETADILREEILSRVSDEAEWLLGSEEEMIRTLGVSRPTLRQAARMLEQEQLLVVRRGIGGGLFGRRPTAEAVSHTASVFLRSHGATWRDLVSTQMLLGAEAARLAARNPDRAEREALRHFYDDLVPRRIRDGLPVDEFILLTVDFQRRIAELTRSAALQLFVNVLMDLSAGSEPVARVYEDVDKRHQTYERHEEIADAVARADSQLAAQRMHAHLDIIHSWAGDGSRSTQLAPPITR